MSTAPHEGEVWEAALDEWQRDPVFYVEDVLKATLWSKQVEIIESLRDNKRTLVRSCHGPGKTFTAAQSVLWFLFAHPYSIVLTTAPTFRQVELILWKELRVAYSRAGGVEAMGGFLRKIPKLELTENDDWFALGFSTDDPDAFQGHHQEHVLVVFDEASGIPVDLWTSVEGVMTSTHCRLLAIGNPTDPTSQFASEFKLPGSHKIAISAFDTPNFTAFGITLRDIIDGSWEQKVDGPMPDSKLVTPEWVADKARRWGTDSPLWTARVMGEFPDTATDALIPLSWIEAAQARNLEPTQPVEVAADIAREGDDETVIGGRAGAVYRMLYSAHNQDTMRTAGEVTRAIQETGAERARIDEEGLGAGVYDRLTELGRPVVGVKASRKASDEERFANARAEMFWGLRERFDPKLGGDIDLDPEDDVLAAQLAAIKWKLDSRGRIIIEKKELMKKDHPQLGSPDRADTLAMAYYPHQDGRDAELW